MPSASEFWRLARAGVRVLRDSEETAEIHLMEELTGRGRFRAIAAEVAADEEGRELLRDRPELRSDRVDYDALRRLPPETLGAAYVGHLDRNGLSADSQAAPTSHIDDDEMAYLMRRFRQTHDVWHAVIGLGTAGHEEVLVHAFSWGQCRLPVSAMIMLGGVPKHFVLERRWGALRRALREAHRSGRAAAPLMPVYWERHWDEPLEGVRARYRITPCTRRLIDS